MKKSILKNSVLSFRVSLLHVLILSSIMNLRVVQSQSGPGGITTSTLWMKADASTNTTINNAAVSSWASQSASPAVTLTQATAGNRPTFKDGSGTLLNGTFNYNPFIYTDGTNNRLLQTGNIDLGNTANGVSVFQVVTHESFTGDVAFEWYHTGNGNIKTKSPGQIYINQFAGTNFTNSRHVNFSAVPEAFIQSLRGVHGTLNSSGNYNGQNDGSYHDGQRVTAQNGISIGANLDNGEFTKAGMGEFIVFPSILDAANTLKVESYLGIKYGVTLGTTVTTSNYVSSNSTVIWTGNAAYQNKIIGIGRDDDSALLQKQSHNYDDTVRIYKGTLASTNINNASTFTNDGSFVVVGTNSAKMCNTPATAIDIPTGLLSCAIVSRLAREWRITKTNYAETFNMDIKLSSCAAPGSVNVADLRLLVDGDGNFANGGTQCYSNASNPGLFTYSNPTITLNNISVAMIPNNGTKFITIATVSTSTPLPIELLNFDAKLNTEETTELAWITSSERDNDFFTIEKSLDGVNWSFIGKVDGAGTISTSNSYYLEDKTPSNGINYYRLKQTDFNGIETEQGIRNVTLNYGNNFILSPNPASSILNIVGKNLNSNEIELFNNLGQKIQIEKSVVSDDKTQINLSNFAKGIYNIRITNSKINENYRVIIE